MRERTHLKIGEFARVGQVSIATLHHYDQCGLLKPNALDPYAGYRWVKGNQYEVIDPPRQVRLQRSEHMHPGQYVTEVQLPVKMQARSEAAISSN